MKKLYRLHNPVKNYNWGSRKTLAHFLGIEKDEKPLAEVWMGANPQSPSLVDGLTGLDRLIESDPVEILGAGDARDFGSLPFLFKLLAAEKPLSIQVHPNLQQAREGWKRENAASISLASPERNYRDANHKPEILCALSPFTAMAGFRPLDETRALLTALELPALSALLDETGGRGESEAIKTLLSGLFALAREKGGIEARKIEKGLEKLEETMIGGVDNKAAALLARRLMAEYPGDLGVLAPCYLNILHLEPGQAIFVDAGILHSYVEGFGVELMANSDNVIRGGLSAKNIDTAELLSILDYRPYRPAILEAGDEAIHSYPTPCREFRLERISCRGSGISIESRRARILVVVEGEVSVRAEEEALVLSRGQSVFIPVYTGRFSLEGQGLLFSAQSAESQNAE